MGARFQVVPLLSEASSTGRIPHDTRAGYLEAIEQGTTAWTTALKEAETNDQILFIHEHPQFPISLDRVLSYVDSERKKSFTPPPTNFTLVPDNLMLHPGTVPIITFRDPVYLIPHAYRSLHNIEGGPVDFDMMYLATLRWQRSLYAWYEAHGLSPIAAEADDYMSSPDFVKKLCVEAGLDPEAAIFKWPRALEEELAAMHPDLQTLLKTLLASDGLRTELAKRGDLNVEVEEVKWKREFGEEKSKFLRELVDANMEDYEFLKGRKLRL